MNELIEELWKKHSKDIPTGFVNVYGCEQMELMVSRESFAQSIQTACEAQRNACVRDFNNYAQRHEYSNNCARVILKAKIERQDYE